MNGKDSSKRIDALTSLRFFAAFIIVLYHAKDNFNCLHGLPDSIVFSQGVTFFFLLSGFILTYVYSHFDSLKEVSIYLVKRVARIWPLHIVLLIGTLLFVPKGMIVQPGNLPEPLVLILNALMLQSWIPNIQLFFSYNAPSWSISTEFFFYLLFPVLLLLLRRAIWLPMLLSFAMVATMIGIANGMELKHMQPNFHFLQGLIAISPLTRLFEFATGVTICALYKRYAGNFDLNRASGTIIEVLSVLSVGLVVLYTKPIARYLCDAANLKDAGYYWLTESGVPLLSFGCLIFVFAMQKGLISKLLSLPVLVMLGEVSYAIYLSHYPLIKYHAFYLSEQNNLVSFVVFLSILFLFSSLLYRLVEMPARRAITRGFVAGLDRSKEPRDEKVDTQASGASGGTNRRYTQLIENFSSNRKGLVLIASQLLMLGALIVCAHPSFDIMGDTEAQGLLSRGNLNQSTVQVGDVLEIEALSTKQSENQTVLEVILKSKQSQVLNHFVSIQLYDDAGKERILRVSRLAPGNTKVDLGSRWKARFTLPEGTNQGADKLAIMVSGKSIYPLTGGRTDMGGRRLLIPLETSLSQKSPSQKLY